MPSYIVKATPTEDFYVMWSTVVDAPTGWGDRAFIESHYPGEHAHACRLCAVEGYTHPEDPTPGDGTAGRALIEQIQARRAQMTSEGAGE